MKKRLLLIITGLFLFSVSNCFASEKTYVQKGTKVNNFGFTFKNAIFESTDSGITLLKSDSEKKEIEQNEFFDWLIKSEKYLFFGAIASTIAFTVQSVTGVICLGIGWGDFDSLYGLYCAGGMLFGFSWLFFLGAGAFWAFWGITQYLKKNDYQVTAFISPNHDEIKACNSGYTVGLSISFY